MIVRVTRTIEIPETETVFGVIKTTGYKNVEIIEEVKDVYGIAVGDSGCLSLYRNNYLPTIYARGCWDKAEDDRFDNAGKV